MHDADRSDASMTPVEVEQVLRRAAELDASLGAHLTVNTLRAIAVEAGIASAALDRALDERRAVRDAMLEEPGLSPWRRLRRLLTRPVAALLDPQSLLDAVARNALSVVSASALVWSAVQLTRILGFGTDGVRLRWAPESIGLLLAAGLAERLRARASAVVLLGVGGALGMRFLVEQVSGDWSLGGTAGGVALLGAGVVGVVLGQLLGSSRNGRNSYTTTAKREGPVADSQQAESRSTVDEPTTAEPMSLRRALEERWPTSVRLGLTAVGTDGRLG